MDDKLELLNELHEKVDNIALQLENTNKMYFRRLSQDKQKEELIAHLIKGIENELQLPLFKDLITVLDRIEGNAAYNNDFIVSLYDEVYDILNSKGVERIKVSCDYDASLYKVVQKEDIESDDDEIEVVEVIRNGYTFNNKILRYAEVSVLVHHQVCQEEQEQELGEEYVD